MSQKNPFLHTLGDLWDTLGFPFKLATTLGLAHHFPIESQIFPY